MDQPGLAHHVSFHVHEEDHDRLHLTKPPAIILRSLSKSDPHLSIPHLLMSQDEDHPSLNRIVSGLFHVGSALRTPNTSCGNFEGIVMSSSGDHHQNPSVVATHLPSDSHCSDGFVASGSSSVHPLSTGSPDGHDNSTNQSHSVFGKMFHRGFFSKPVMRSEEESYRYLMALDR
ncbi:unnamed protein product [Angiostrongylus costaricensis]|uniref:Ovule protein n=1 Tax=Angiostrongylus costaricensis TaxID=334426 RepID=A0A158PJ06_ANGCS|nr:unnamed protein product [Angiostrongylus costaricensis]